MKDYPNIKELLKISHGWWYPVGGNVRKVRFRWGRRLELFFDGAPFAVSIPDFKAALSKPSWHRLVDLTGEHRIQIHRRPNDIVRIDLDDGDLYALFKLEDIQWWSRVF